MVENVLVHHDKRLMQQFVSCKVTSQVRSLQKHRQCHVYVAVRVGFFFFFVVHIFLKVTDINHPCWMSSLESNSE